MDPIPAFISLSNVSPILIPIVGFVMVALLGVVAMVLKAKDKERIHRERLFLAERGMDIPGELYGPRPEHKEKRGDYRTLRTWLIIFGYLGIVIGISTIITVAVQQSLADGIGGIFGIAIGLGFLVSERIIVTHVVRNGQGGGSV